jgi:cbb3-type cytochrome oxidase subunit 3
MRGVKVVFILRVLVLIIILIIAYGAIKHFINPRRKLAYAIANRQTLLMDDKQDIRKNLLIAYKGSLFEGEKYMGTIDGSFQIIQIHLQPQDNQKLIGFDVADFLAIEQQVLALYSHAQISWGSPVKELVRKTQKE